MKLKAGGYNTIESIAHTTLRKMQDVKGKTKALFNGSAPSKRSGSSVVKNGDNMQHA